MTASLIIHDTFIVLRANEAALVLFRAREDQLIGAALQSLLYDTDAKMLADFRMQIARARPDLMKLPVIEFVFKRFDDTFFFGRVTTHRTDVFDEWESQIDFVSEY